MRPAILRDCLPRRRVHHISAQFDAAPVTVIMLHVNWLIGGVVVVESYSDTPDWVTSSSTPPSARDIYSIEDAYATDLPCRQQPASSRHFLRVLNPRIPLFVGESIVRTSFHSCRGGSRFRRNQSVS